MTKPTGKPTARASYKEGIDFIVHNDEPMETSLEVVEEFVSVLTLAAAFRVPHTKVAEDVVRKRLNLIAADKL